MEYFSIEQIDATTAFVRERINYQPKIGMILGSGLGGLADEIENPDIISFNEIPNWPVSTVWGHTGRLVVGNLVGQPVMVMQGRSHYYEGYSMLRLGCRYVL